MNRKVLFINKAHPVLEQELTKLGFECELDEQSTNDQIESKIHNYFGIVIRSRIGVDRSLLDKAVNLSFVAREGVGTEHIDLEYAAQKGITVITSPEGSRDAVGEHALGMLLSLMANLAKSDRQIRNGQWLREENRAYEIKGKTVGILGYGNMGRAFAQRLKGFEADVIAYDKYLDNYGDEHAEAVSLEKLFERSDILSLHIPYMPPNHHFVDGAFIQNFKKDIFIVNTARGLVLETAALVDNMKSGKVLGAALDVLEYEEMSFEFLDLDSLPEPFQYLRNSDRVVLTPHIGGWSFESKKGHAEVLAEKIKARFTE
ncbi:MAG: hydroxyacid dehydrogenase [Bacteroidetes bacterium]|nr:MAG: hydroxyacid dehydrogenase [Bacteroidota bacterium]